MIVSIHQPSYFPWLGTLDKIKKSDLYIYLNSVQLIDNSYQHRNIFLSNQLKEHLLTIPINKKNYLSKTINELETIDDRWKKKHYDFLFFNYKKHPYFNEINPYLEKFYSQDFTNLDEILFSSMKISLDLLGIKTKIIKSSDLNLDKNLKKEDLILEILEQVKATTYLSGTGAKSYQNEENFKAKGIKLVYQDFKHPIYEQYKNKEFVFGLSCLDFLFNKGIQK